MINTGGNTMAIKPLFKTFRKAKVSYPWLPPLQLRSAHDYMIFSRCSAGDVRALEEIREALMLEGNPQFAAMKLLHVPGRGGESERQYAIFCRLRGWQEMMNEARLINQRKATELYAKGFFMKEIAREIKTRDKTIRFHIAKGLHEYNFMYPDPIDLSKNT